MSDSLYSATCNPPRRAKRLPLAEPSPDTPSMQPADTTDGAPATTPAKRGRKPGPLSRSAREAQRRLNHSIIEKARRTKINDALATLRQLVPVDYGSPQSQHPDPDEEDEEDDDDEYPQGTKKSKPKTKPTKGTGKREEKEKEFKLEILVRTVSFLQDLLKRVDTMENTPSPCQRCGASQSSKKRKHTDDHDHEREQPSKVIVHSVEDHPRPAFKPLSSNPIPNPHNSPVPNQEPPTNTGPRLPSISSWLPDVPIDPTLLSPQTKPKSSPFPYLPSPPSSTLFVPVRTSQVPPVLNLGPVATAALVAPLPPPPHTSEDESAASLLLQIATSPPFRPSIPTTTTISNYNLPDPSKFSSHSDTRNQRTSAHIHLPETPRSLLGLHDERPKY